MKPKHRFRRLPHHAQILLAALSVVSLVACTQSMTAAERYGGIADPRSFWLHAIETHQSYDYRFCLAENMTAAASPELEKTVDVFLEEKTDANFHFVAMRYYIETETPDFQERFARASCRGPDLDVDPGLPELKSAL